MEQTRMRAAALGWQLACPAVVWDVDRAGDLDRLAHDFPVLKDGDGARGDGG